MTLWGREQPPGFHNLHHGFPASLFEPPSDRGISDTGRGGGWSRIFCISVFEEYVPGGQVLELSYFYSVVEKCLVLQVRNDVTPPYQ